MTDRERSVILGSLLGDGSLSRPASANANALFQEGHGARQRDYLLWKAAELERFTPHVREYRGGSVVVLTTPNDPALTIWRRLAYPEGRKSPHNILPYCDDLATAIWFMDDGNLAKRGEFYVLSTCSFTIEEHEEMVSWFHERYGVEPTIFSYRKGKYLSLRFRQSDSWTLAERMAPLFHPSMAYKLPTHLRGS